MGLDQYAFAIDSDGEEETLMRWRKHNRLQGWMVSKAIDTGVVSGEGEFNCKPLPLSVDDITDLETCINERKLPETVGFFFGDDSYDDDYEEYDLKSDLEFIRLAKDAISRGQRVSYSCWY